MTVSCRSGLTPREISRYAQRELNILKQHHGEKDPGRARVMRLHEAERLRLAFKTMNRLCDSMAESRPEYREEAEALKQIFTDSLKQSRKKDGSSLARIGRFQGTLEVVAEAGASLGAPGAVSLAAGKVLAGRKYVYAADPKYHPEYPSWHDKNDAWHLERHKNLLLVEGGLQALKTVAGFQGDKIAQTVIEAGPQQAISLEYLKDLETYRTLEPQIFSRMAQKELQLLHREPRQPKKETGGDKAFRLSEESGSAVNIIGELAHLAQENPALDGEAAQAAEKIAVRALEFKGLQPDERIGRFQGALEVLAVLDEPMEKGQIGKAASRVLNGTGLVINEGGEHLSGGSLREKLSRKLSGRPQPSGGELSRDEMLENWKNRGLYQGGLESIGILAGEIGCRKAEKILHQKNGKEALKALKKLR